MRRLFSKSRLSRIYARSLTGTTICSSLLTYWWWKECAGSRFWMQLDYTLDILSKDWPTTERERSHEETEVPSIAICANKRRVLQKRILVTVPKVFKPWGSRLRNERSSRGYLWKPLRGTVVSAQADPSGVLLANYAERCTSLLQDLWQVSEVQQIHQTTVRRANTHDGPLAIRSIGTSYHGSLPNRG